MSGDSGTNENGAEASGCGPAGEIARDPDTGEITGVTPGPAEAGGEGAAAAEHSARSEETLRRLLEGAGASSDEAEFYVTRFLPSLGPRRSPGAGGAGGKSSG